MSAGRLLVAPLVGALLAATGVAVDDRSAAAAPPTAPWSARATGTVAAVGVQAVGIDLADVGLASSDALTSSQTVPRSRSESANLQAAVLGLPILRSTTGQVAPPDPGDAQTGSLLAVNALGIGLGALTTRNEANWSGDGACVTSGPITDTLTQTAGVGVAPLGINLLSTGVSATRGTTSLVPTAAGSLNHAVRSQATGTLTGVSVLGGAVQVGVAGTATLSSTATGAAGGASVSYQAPLITVGSAQGTVSLVPGQSTSVDLGAVGAVTVTAGLVSRTEAADGRSATGSVTVLTIAVRAGPAIAPLARATVGLLPLQTQATAPAGGIDCPPPPPVIATPSEGALVSTATPAVTGTGVPGALVDLVLDGATVATGVPVAANGTWSWTPAAPLAQGPHTVTARQSVAGVASVLSPPRTFTVDSLAPAAPVVLLPANGSSTADRTPTVSGTAEPGSTVTVVVDGTPVGTTTASGTGTWSLDAPAELADGPHTAQATATDAAGNVSGPSNTNAFTVDATAPEAPVVVAPADGSSTADATPTYSGTAEAGSTVTVVVDGAPVGTAPVGAEGTWTLTPATPLASGPHTVQATATDALGNVSAPSAPNAFVVDTAPPPAPVVLTPPDGSVTTDTTPTVTGTAEPLSTVTVLVDDVAIGTTQADGSGDWSLVVPAPLADGDHTARATATDAAGNVSPSSAAVVFTVDTTATGAPVVVTPANGSVTDDTTPTYSGTGEVGSTVTVVVDGAAVGTAPVAAGGTWTLTPATPLAEGLHAVWATATDGAGNVSPVSNTNAFTVDTVAPAAPVVVTPADGSVTSDTTPQLAGTAEPGSQVTVVVDGVAVGVVPADGSGAWTLTSGELAGGPHTVQATSADAAGNVSPVSNTNGFVVDADPPPAPAVTAPADGTTTADSTPTVTGTAEPGTTVTVTVDGAVVGTAPVDGSGAWTLTVAVPLADGPHTVQATAADGAGNTSPPSATNTFTVDTAAPAAPVVTAPADASVTADSTPTYTGTAEPGSSVTVSVDGAAVGTVTADATTGAWTLTPAAPLADGPHAVAATAVDAAGSPSPPSATNTFTVDTAAPAAPVVVAPPNGSTTSDSTPTIAGTAEPGATVTVQLDGATLGTTTASGTGSWSVTPAAPLADGPHTVSATATDAAGTTSPASATTTFTVDTTAPAPPVVVAPADGSTTTDQTPTVSGTAEPGSTVTVLVDRVAVGTTPADGTGAWSLVTPTPLTEGPHEVSATATDGSGNTSPESPASTVTVDSGAPAPPVVTTPADGSATSDTTPAYAGTAEPGTNVTVLVDGVAVGTTPADAVTGAWGLTQPLPLVPGPHTVAATASDGVGSTSPPSPANTFVVTPPPPPPPPVVVAPADGSVTGDSTPGVTGTSQPGTTVTVSIDGTPVGTAAADGLGAWTLETTTPLADGPRTVTAVASQPTGTPSLPSAPSTFTVDTTPPAPPAVTAPGSVVPTATPVVGGTAEPGSTVAVVVDGAPVGATTADGSGSWTLPLTTPLADGPHTVAATATDVAGNASTASSTIDFTVDTVGPPAPVVVSPAVGQVTGDSTPTVTGTAEAGTTVTVVVDGVAVGTTTAGGTGTWSLDVPTPLADGAHAVRATATDAAGNVSPASSTNVFTVDTGIPAAPAVVSPADGSVTGDSTPTVAGTAEPTSTVTVLVDGAPVGTTNADGTGAWSLEVPTALADGPHTVAATATDAAGNASPASATNGFTVDTGAPVVPVITSPADGAATADTTPTVQGTAEPGSTVTVLVDGTPVGTTTADGTGAWTLPLPVPLAEGSHELTATGTDAAGNTSPPSAAVTVVVDTTPPAAPVVTTPADGSVTGDSTPDVGGTAEPGATVTVEVDGVPVGTTTADGTGAWTLPLPTPLADGPHEVVATATDAAGNTSPPSAPSTVTVDSSLPAAPVVTTPADGSTTDDATPAISGTAEPGATVTVEVDGTVVGTTTADGTGAWTLTPTVPLGLGEHEVVATATDAAGNESAPSAPVSFTVVAGAVPPPVIVSPADGSVISDRTPEVSGTGLPGAVVTLVWDGQVYGTAVVAADGTWRIPVTAVQADGWHTLQAFQTLPLTGQGSVLSARSDVLVDATAPAAPTIVSPADGSSTTDRTPQVRGTGEPGATVTVRVDGVVVGTAVVGADGTWTLDLSRALTVAGHVLSVVQTDAAGNVSPEAVADFAVVAASGGGGGGGGGRDARDRSDLPRTGTDPVDALLASLVLVLGGAVLLRPQRARRRRGA
ncbi:hypothetical protein GCM10028777_37860 [Angustibacter speluncae]